MLLHKQKIFSRFFPKGYDHKLLDPFQDRKIVDIINWIDQIERKYGTFTNTSPKQNEKKLKTFNEIV